MATELLPVVDLRALSQSDLDALAAASAHALAPRSCPDADPLPPLKIDRAVFNESAGSRKQTFSRLRLAAASSSPTARPTSASSAPRSSVRKDPDSGLVAYHLRRLFVPDDPSLPPPPESQTLASPSPPPDPDRETTNSKGVSVDLVRLAGMVDPYDAELRRRTAGLGSETELMGFIASVAGKWATQRQRRKFVDASFFGDHLPRGWKLLLGLKRKERMTWVHCFSYVSPKGSQFASCKEVSAYLMSLLGYPEAKTVTTLYDSTPNADLSADNGRDDVIGFQHQIGSSVDNPNVLRLLPDTSVTVSSYSGDLMNSGERNVDTISAYECQIPYSQHNLSSHEVAAKRRRTGKFGEPVVGKDGKFECPVCHKTFTEESRYFGHVGSHARYQGLTPGAFLDKITSGKVDSNSLAEISFSLQELEHGGEAGYQHLGGSNEHGINASKDLSSPNCLDGFHRTNEAWHRHEEIPNIPYAPSACNSIGQPDGRHNGSEVTIYNYQASSHHAFSPNTFGCGNPSEGQIVDHGMASKHGEVNNTAKARDVNLNSCSGTSYLPIASANNETSTALNEASQPPFTAKHSSSSFSNNVGVSSASTCSASTNKRGMSLDVANKTPVAASTCFSASHGNNSGRDKVIGNQNNTVVYQYNMGMRPVSPMETEANVGGRSSMVCSVGDAPASNTIQDQCDLQLGFGVQKQQIFSGYEELRSTTSGSHRSGISGNNSLPTGPSQFGSMARPNSFPSGSSQFGSLARPDVPTSFQFGIMAGPNSVPPAESSQFGSISRPNSAPHTKSREFGSMARPPVSSQFGSMSSPNYVSPPDSSQFGSMARPNSVPHVKFSQFGSISRPNYAPPANSSQFGSTARSSSFPPTEASEFGNMTREHFVSRNEPTLVLGYAPQMGNGPPVQIGWDLASSKVTGDMMTCVCIWCNSQFHHFGPADGQHTGAFGFICPACKEKISGHPNMRNNGSWQP